MAGELLMTLREIPSFEGELSVRLMEKRDSEGRAGVQGIPREWLRCQEPIPRHVVKNYGMLSFPDNS